MITPPPARYENVSTLLGMKRMAELSSPEHPRIHFMEQQDAVSTSYAKPDLKSSPQVH